MLRNAVVLAETLIARGQRIVSGRTESHVMLVDLRAKRITGKEAESGLVGNLVADVLDAPHDACRIALVRDRVAKLTSMFPVYR